MRYASIASRGASVIALVAAILVVALPVAGCATHTIPRLTQYYLDVKPVEAKAASTDKTVGIRPLDSARPYKQRIVYRMPDFTLGSDDAIEWAELPRSFVTRALADALAACGRFKDVGNAADLAMPDWMLTGEVRKFDENRASAPWTADCEVRLELRDTQSGGALWADTVSASIPLERDEHAALPAAMSKAVATVVEQAVKQIVTK